MSGLYVSTNVMENFGKEILEELELGEKHA